MGFVQVRVMSGSPHAPRTPGDANMTDVQLGWLEKTAKEVPIKHFLEVGVYKGVTTTHLAKFGTVVAVDWFAGNPEWHRAPDWKAGPNELNDRLGGFLRCVQEQGVGDKITILSGKSDDVLPFLKNDTFGLVLIDANHAMDFCYRDLVNTWDSVVSGGWVFLDDFSDVTIGEQLATPCPVRLAWEKFAKERGLDMLPLYTADDGGRPKLVGIKKP